MIENFVLTFTNTCKVKESKEWKGHIPLKAKVEIFGKHHGGNCLAFLSLELEFELHRMRDSNIITSAVKQISDQLEGSDIYDLGSAAISPSSVKNLMAIAYTAVRLQVNMGVEKIR